MNPLLTIHNQNIEIIDRDVPHVHINYRQQQEFLDKHGLTSRGEFLHKKVTDLGKCLRDLEKAKKNETWAKVTSICLTAIQIAYVAVCIFASISFYSISPTTPIIFSYLTITGAYQTSKLTKMLVEDWLSGAIGERTLLAGLFATPIHAIHYAFSRRAELALEAENQKTSLQKEFEDTISCYKQHYPTVEKKLKEKETVLNDSLAKGNFKDPWDCLLDGTLSEVEVKQEKEKVVSTMAHLQRMNEYLNTLPSKPLS